LEALYARPCVQHDDAILRAIAQNPNASRWLLEKLSVHPDKYVRMQVAANPGTSRTILREIHHTRELDSTLGLNPNTPPAVLKEIARSGDERARWNVASNQATPTDILTALSQDDRQTVRARASLRLQERAHPRP
jgi:hypothetical protein